MLSALFQWSHFSLKTTLWSWYFYYPCSTNNEAKSKGDNETSEGYTPVQGDTPSKEWSQVVGLDRLT